MKHHYVNGPPVNFVYKKYLNNPIYAIVPPVINMVTPATSIIEEMSTPIEIICDLYQTLFDIDSTVIFDEFKKMTSEADKAFLVYIGKDSNSLFDNSNGHVHKHIHFPRMDKVHYGNYLSNTRRTVTAVVPISVTDPVTEMVCYIEFEYEFLNTKNLDPTHSKQVQWLNKNVTIDESKTQKIKLPEAGQYLILDFDSAHNLHWIENAEGSNNEYICLILDI